MTRGGRTACGDGDGDNESEERQDPHVRFTASARHRFPTETSCRGSLLLRWDSRIRSATGIMSPRSISSRHEGYGGDTGRLLTDPGVVGRRQI